GNREQGTGNREEGFQYVPSSVWLRHASYQKSNIIPIVYLQLLINNQIDLQQEFIRYML
ncbi:MAG: hypothetical protein RLZZ86_728, partial [Cyanobacteriota bacterium]